MGPESSIHVMAAAPPEANQLIQAMAGQMGSSGRYQVGLTLERAWSALHPNSTWTPTLVVGSEVMDAIRPPYARSENEWAFSKFLQELERKQSRQSAITGKTFPTVISKQGLLKDLWPRLLASQGENNWVRDAIPQMEGDLGLPPDTVRRAAQHASERMEFVALGCCISVDSNRALLDPHCGPEVLKELSMGGRLCLLDCERIWRSSARLSRSNESIGPGYRTIVEGILGWVVWVHEQSHATRGSDGGPAEEMQAQLETYRVFEEGREKEFSGLGVSPSHREIMRRLALRQPPEYQVVFRKEVREALAQ